MTPTVTEGVNDAVLDPRQVPPTVHGEDVLKLWLAGHAPELKLVQVRPDPDDYNVSPADPGRYGVRYGQVLVDVRVPVCQNDDDVLGIRTVPTRRRKHPVVLESEGVVERMYGKVTSKSYKHGRNPEAVEKLTTLK